MYHLNIWSTGKYGTCSTFTLSFFHRVIIWKENQNKSLILQAHLPFLPTDIVDVLLWSNHIPRHERVLCFVFCVCQPRAVSVSTMAESDPEPIPSGAGQRLGAPETLGISTLDPGHRPPAMPPGRHVTIRVRMLDDTEELFDVSVSRPDAFSSRQY